MEFSPWEDEDDDDVAVLQMFNVATMKNTRKV